MHSFNEVQHVPLNRFAAAFLSKTALRRSYYCERYYEWDTQWSETHTMDNIVTCHMTLMATVVAGSFGDTAGFSTESPPQ